MLDSNTPPPSHYSKKITNNNTMKYCQSLGQCEEDYCDCDNVMRMEAKEERNENIKKGVAFGLLLVGLFFAIIL